MCGNNEIYCLGGKTALITGGSSGIGFAMARAMAQAGARVAIVGLSDRVDVAVDSLKELNSGCRGFKWDLTEIDTLEALVENVERDVGPVDVLVNSAGINLRGRADEFDFVDWRRVVTLNLDVPFVLSAAWARRRIAAKQKGSILMMASLTSEQARPSLAAYSASKGGVRQLVKSLAVDWAQFGIRVNGIGPGYIATEMNRTLVEDQGFTDWVISSTPMARWGHPEDVGPVAVFLASDAAAFITGQILYVDGGWTAAL